MTKPADSSVEQRLARLERQLRIQRGVAGLIVLAVAAYACAALPPGEPAAMSDTLRVRELVVMDGNGVARVRIGGDLPDAVIDGRRLPRGEAAAGLLLYDDGGRERGGYVTFAPSGNVALTLDTRERQVALFAADPVDGAVARLWSPDGRAWVEMRAATGAARFSAGADGEVVYQQPALTQSDADAVCSEFMAEVERLDPRPPRADLLAACNRHLPAEQCALCIGVP